MPRGPGEREVESEGHEEKFGPLLLYRFSSIPYGRSGGFPPLREAHRSQEGAATWEERSLRALLVPHGAGRRVWLHSRQSWVAGAAERENEHRTRCRARSGTGAVSRGASHGSR